MKAFASLAVLMAVLASGACGGETKIAERALPPPPKPTESPHLSIMVDRANSYDAHGTAFAQLDPEQGMLAVFVFDPNTLPEPSCATLAMASLNLESGGFAVIRLRGQAKKETGTFPITGGGFISENVRTHETRMASSGPEASNLVIRIFDTTHLVAEATSEASAEMQIHGSISATVCPDGALGAAGQAPQTSPSDLSASAGDAGADIDAGPPPKPTKKKKRKKRHH